MMKFYDPVSEIGRTLRRHRKALVQVAMISAVLNVLMLSGSFFMLLVYDEVLPSRSVPTLLGLILIVSIVYVFQSALDLIRARAMIQVGAIVDQKVTSRVFDVLTRYELSRGGLRDGLQPVRDLDQIRGFLSGPGPLAIIDLPWVLLFLAVLFMFHYALGLLALAGVLILVTLMIMTDRLTRTPTREAAAVASARYALADSTRRNADVLQALGMAGRVREAWTRLSDNYLIASDRLAEVSGRMQSISKTFRMLFQSLMLAAGAALVIDDAATGGIIIASSILGARALAPVDQAIANWKGMLATKEAWFRLEALMEQVPPAPMTMPLPAPRSSLAVEAVSVGPPGSQTITAGDVSFNLKAGEALGIIGASGSGKSSLLRAIVGVWPTARGNIRYDGAALDQWSPEALGQHIGFIPQQIDLLDGTVAQNISRFDSEFDSEAILAAAKAADVHELIVRFSQGYEHPLGPNGGNLSAGQKQRVALARALYKNPFLLALDEPNSNLDMEGETALIRAMAAAKERGAIVIIVAHRPAVLADVDLILVMDRGRTKFFGPREEVLAQLNLPPARPAPTPIANVSRAS